MEARGESYGIWFVFGIALGELKESWQSIHLQVADEERRAQLQQELLALENNVLFRRIGELDFRVFLAEYSRLHLAIGAEKVKINVQ
jgi:hypothetical protein